MREKEGFIPKKLSGAEDVVFDGYSNPIEALSHSLYVSRSIYGSTVVATSAATRMNISVTNIACFR